MQETSYTIPDSDGGEILVVLNGRPLGSSWSDQLVKWNDTSYYIFETDMVIEYVVDDEVHQLDYSQSSKLEMMRRWRIILWEASREELWNGREN